MDSNHRKQTLADLQSAPFDRSGTYPLVLQAADAACGETLHDFFGYCKSFFNFFAIFLLYSCGG